MLKKTIFLRSSRMKRKLIILLILVSVFLAIGCTGKNSGQSPTPTTPATTTAQTNLTANSAETPSNSTGGNTIEVKMEGFAFNPDSVTISPGDTVKWTNMDSAGHDVSGSEFKSNMLQKGDSYEHQFPKSGTYDYVCSVHPNMKGTVIVK
jgi:plastocyanin